MKRTRIFRTSALLLAAVLAVSPLTARPVYADGLFGGSKDKKVDNKAAEDAAKQTNENFSSMHQATQQQIDAARKDIENAKTPEERQAAMDRAQKAFDQQQSNDKQWQQWRQNTGGLAGAVDKVANGSGNSSYGGYGSGNSMMDYFKYMMMMQLANTAANIVGNLINQGINKLLNPSSSDKDKADAAKTLGDLERERDGYSGTVDKAAAGMAANDPNAATGGGTVAGGGLPSVGGSDSPYTGGAVSGMPSGGGGTIYGGGGGYAGGGGGIYESPFGGGGGGASLGGAVPFGGGSGGTIGGEDPKGPPDGVNGAAKPGEGKADGSPEPVAEEITRKTETISGRLIFLPKPKPGSVPSATDPEASPSTPSDAPAPAAPAPQPATSGSTVDPATGPDPVEQPVDQPAGKVATKKNVAKKAIAKREKVKADEKAEKLKGIKAKKTPPELIDALVKVEMAISEWKRVEKAKASGEDPQVAGDAKPASSKADALEAARGDDGKIDFSKVDVWLVSDWKKETPRRFHVSFDPDAAASLTSPVQGATVVVRGSVARLDIDKQILEELRGEVNDVEITQVMLSAAGPKPDGAEGADSNDGQ